MTTAEAILDFFGDPLRNRPPIWPADLAGVIGHPVPDVVAALSELGREGRLVRHYRWTPSGSPMAPRFTLGNS